MGKVLAWHFTDGWKLRDGQTLIEGKTYRHNGELKLCPSDEDLAQGKGGYHGSKQIIDALKYAPGTVVSWCEFNDIGKEAVDKFVAKERTVLWAIDIEMILHEFACRCAEHALKRHNCDYPHCYAAIDAKRKWMRGEITDNELYAAREAARDSVRQTPRDYAREAARDSARESAWEAARMVTLDFVWVGARQAQNRLLRSMVLKAKAASGEER